MGMDQFGTRHIEVGLSAVANIAPPPPKEEEEKEFDDCFGSLIEGEVMFRMNYVNEVMDD